MSGMKSGYSLDGLEVTDDGRTILTEQAEFRVSMAGVQQEMRWETRREYAPDGGLSSIHSIVVDPEGRSEWRCVVVGDEMEIRSLIAGREQVERIPAPDESLADALRAVTLVRSGPEVGEEISFAVYDPVHGRTMEGASQIVAVENRLLDGATTKVYKVKSTVDLMGIDTYSYVTEQGLLLEDVIAGGILTMRLEPEAMAKDVDYSNDVIVSNAAMVEEPIENPRKRESLTLRITGPLKPEHLFNDERQYLVERGDAFVFEAHRIDTAGIEAPALPVTTPDLAEWLEPTQFIQSDDERLVAKARELVGDAPDALVASNTLCEWVYDNVRTAYSARLSNALEVLDSLEGDCTEHSVLFIGLARAAGIPARAVAGLVYVDGANPGFYFHQWAKVWVGKWIDVDPTFNQPVADVTHIKLAEGDLFEQARLIPIIGHLAIEVPDEAAGGDEVAGAPAPGQTEAPGNADSPAEGGQTVEAGEAAAPETT
jgi:transglutaminase-like putative cysteine protease